MQEDNPVCLQPKLLGDVCPQSLHGLSLGDSELQQAAGGRGDGQTHGGLTGGDLSLAARRPATAEATWALLLLHLWLQLNKKSPARWNQKRTKFCFLIPQRRLRGMSHLNEEISVLITTGGNSSSPWQWQKLHYPSVKHLDAARTEPAHWNPQPISGRASTEVCLHSPIKTPFWTHGPTPYCASLSIHKWCNLPRSRNILYRMSSY